jgi:hypothetical protein
VTLLAPRFRQRRAIVLLLATLLAGLLVVPTTFGVSSIIDRYRFGHFEHETFSDVQDFRIERWLPPKATDISLFKFSNGNGYIAKYKLSEVELNEYLNELWDKFGDESATARKEGAVDAHPFWKRKFVEVNWDLPEDLLGDESPTELDGGGATYFLDRSSSTVFQTSCYW